MVCRSLNYSAHPLEQLLNPTSSSFLHLSNANNNATIAFIALFQTILGLVIQCLLESSQQTRRQSTIPLQSLPCRCRNSSHEHEYTALPLATCRIYGVIISLLLDHCAFLHVQQRALGQWTCQSDRKLDVSVPNYPPLHPAYADGKATENIGYKRWNARVQIDDMVELDQRDTGKNTLRLERALRTMTDQMLAFTIILFQPAVIIFAGR